jgi:hypothetical protein
MTEAELQARVARIARTAPYQAEAQAMVVERRGVQRLCCEECDPVGRQVSVFDWQCTRCPDSGEELATHELAHEAALDHLEIHAWDDERVFDGSEL